MLNAFRHQRLKQGQSLGTSDYTEIIRQVICEHKRFCHKASSIIQLPTEAQIKAVEKPKAGLDDDALAHSLAGLLDVA